jgi:hypothetical protein
MITSPAMISDKIKQLEATKAKMASLVKAISAELHRELRALPAKYGFDNVQDFIAAVRNAGGGKGKTARGRKRRTRAVITDAMRAEVKKLATAGKTGAEIAAAVGISVPSVQNIKKAFGLVKAR